MASNARFNNNFLDLRTESEAKPDLYRDYFLNYDLSKWRVGSGGGPFKYFDGEGQSYSLTIMHDGRCGIALAYQKWDEQKNRPKGTNRYSLGDEAALGEMFETEDDFVMPRGIYMKPEETWCAVLDFLTDPTQPSEKIRWVDGKNISWPDL